MSGAISDIIKLRKMNGTSFVTIPKKIANILSNDTTHFLIFIDEDNDEITLRPLSSAEVLDG